MSNNLEELKEHPELIELLDNPTEEEQMVALGIDPEYSSVHINNPTIIKLIKHQAESVKLAMVRNYGLHLLDIENPSTTVIKAAIESDPHCIALIKDQTEELQLLAIKRFEHYPGSYKDFRYFVNPSKRVQIKAVSVWPEAIKYIKDPSEILLKSAVSVYPGSIRFVEHPSQELIDIVIKRSNRYDYFMVLDYIKKPTKDTIIKVLKNDQRNINYVPKGTFTDDELIKLLPEAKNIIYYSDTTNMKLISAALAISPELINKDQANLLSDSQKLIYVQYEYSNIDNIEDQTEELQYAAVDAHYKAISYCKNQTKNLQLNAVNKDLGAIFCIREPFPEVLEFARQL